MIQKIQRNDHRDQHIQIILADEENSGCFLLTCLITASSTAPAGTLQQVLRKHFHMSQIWDS